MPFQTPLTFSNKKIIGGRNGNKIMWLSERFLGDLSARSDGWRRLWLQTVRWLNTPYGLTTEHLPPHTHAIGSSSFPFLPSFPWPHRGSLLRIHLAFISKGPFPFAIITGYQPTHNLCHDPEPSFSSSPCSQLSQTTYQLSAPHDSA